MSRELGFLDGFSNLWNCSSPGASCNAHDTCVQEAICGDDNLCHPVRAQNCDDGLACTADTCGTTGVCSNLPQAGTCALPVKVDKDGKTVTEMRCFTDGQRHPDDPCRICVGAGDRGSGTSWSLATGGTCDDGDGCTKDDLCQDGVCKGTSYLNLCADKYSCTDDLCDGEGGCLDHKLKSNACLISNVCYTDQQGDETGCNICDVKTSQSTWTPLGSKCQVSGKCYKPGQKTSDNCSICDPAKDPNGWTALANVCKIDAYCQQSGAVHPQGCAICDPVANPNAWTVTGNNCLISGTCYKELAKDSSACLICDPSRSPTDWSPVPNTCKISGVCHQASETDATTCGVCDPSVSTTTWTVKGDKCLIGASCFSPGQTNTAGCGVCDTAQSKTAWSPPAGNCLIAGACVADQGKDNTGCRICDINTNTTAWTPVSGATLTTEFFEDGKNPPTGWSVTNTSSTVGWVVCNRRPLQGSFSLYYGDPNTGTFELAAGSSLGTADMPPVTLAAGKKAGLTFLLYLDTDAFLPLIPVFSVQVNGTEVWVPQQGFTMRTWQEIAIDLSSYAGQEVKVQFRVDTSKSWFNFGEGVFIDAVSIFHNC